MSNQRDNDREAYYRFAISNKDGSRLPYELGMRVLGYEDATRLRIQQQKGRVVEFTPMSEAAQRDYVEKQYAGEVPRGIGARQGEFITLAAEEVNDDTRFIATDFLIDCHALTLVARDSNGKVLRTLLTHVDAMTDIPKQIPKLVSRMPEGSRIEATVLGSPYNYSHFIQSDVMDALMNDKRIARIRYNFDAATTVALDTTTGRILTASPRETDATSAHITQDELPLDITFYKEGNAIGATYRRILHSAFKTGRAMSTLELEETYRGGTGFITETSLVRFVLDRAPDGLSTTELQEITDLLSNKLQQPLRVEPTSPDEYGRARFAVKTQSGSELGDFIVPSSPAQPATAEVKAETDMPSR